MAFLIPAYNEARSLAERIHAIDAAAALTPRACNLYVVDNASTDDTVEVARAAIDACTAVDGEVLNCPTPGKSRALNFGLPASPRTS